MNQKWIYNKNAFEINLQYKCVGNQFTIKLHWKCINDKNALKMNLQ